MATTVMIVEVIVVGIFSSLWIFMVLLRLSLVDLSGISECAAELKDWTALFTIVAIAVLYQLGWLMNTLGHVITEWVFLGRLIRKRMFKHSSLEYMRVRTKVYQEASSSAREDLGVDRSVIRLSRG